MWETAIIYFNNLPEIGPQINEWAHHHPGVELKNFRHQISDDPHKGSNMWLFDFKKFGS